MKRILLACCLMAATCSFSYGQTNTIQEPQAVSKTEYTSQVGQMNTFLTSNKIDDAQHKWEDVHKLMLNTLAYTKNQIRHANDAQNQDEVKRIMDVMVKQRNLYTEILQMARGDMAGNKAKLNEKLKEFGSTML